MEKVEFRLGAPCVEVHAYFGPRATAIKQHVRCGALGDAVESVSECTRHHLQGTVEDTFVHTAYKCRVS